MSYYVLPAGNVIGTVPPAARCYPEQAAALQAELTRGLAAAAPLFGWRRKSATTTSTRKGSASRCSPEEVGERAAAPGDAYAGTTSEVEQRGVMGAAIPAGSATVVGGVVPDRVAKVPSTTRESRAPGTPHAVA